MIIDRFWDCHVLSDFIVLGYHTSFTKDQVCPVCEKSKMQTTIYIRKNDHQHGYVCDTCAGNYTKQYKLIQKMVKKIKYLHRIRTDMDDICWMPEGDIYFDRLKGKKRFKERYLARYINCRAEILETDDGSFMVKLDGESLMSKYYETLDDAKIGVFRAWGRLQMTNLFDNYYHNGQE